MSKIFTNIQIKCKAKGLLSLIIKAIDIEEDLNEFIRESKFDT